MASSSWIMVGFAFLASCSPGNRTAVSPPAHSYRELDQPKQPPPRETESLLEVREITADLDLLVYALERGYVGRRFVPGASWADMMSRLTRLREKPASIADLCHGIADALWQLPDSHLAARRRSPKERM